MRRWPTVPEVAYPATMSSHPSTSIPLMAIELVRFGVTTVAACWRRLSLHSQLFEVKVALDPAQHHVGDHAAFV